MNLAKRFDRSLLALFAGLGACTFGAVAMNEARQTRVCAPTHNPAMCRLSLMADQPDAVATAFGNGKVSVK